MFDKRCRAGVERGLRPVGSGLERAGVSADQLTVVGLLISVAAALAVANGRLGLGAFLLAASAVPDLLDGAVAKAAGTASPRGAFFDSVVDRVSDMVVLGGFAWYLGSVDGGHAAMLPLAVLGASSLVSYERARAESLGFTARGGLMERAERMLALGACLVFSALMVPILWLMLGLTLFTAGHRFAMVWRQAGAAARPEKPKSRSTMAGVAGRWRGWTPGVSSGPSTRSQDGSRWGAGSTPRSDAARRRPPRTRP